MSKQSKKKGRVVKPAKKSHMTTYVVVGIVAAIIVAASAWYVYSSSRQTTTTSSTTDTGTSGFVYAVITTSQGTMEAELFRNETPATVNNFVSLADSGFYTDLVWHRIVREPATATTPPFDLIQTGDPTSEKGAGNPCSWGDTSSPKTVPLEIVPSLHNYVGYLGMARLSGNNNSGSSQFYINLSNNTSLDGGYTVFGKLISGLSVAQAIGSLPINPSCNTATDGPPETPSDALVLSITIKNSP